MKAAATPDDPSPNIGRRRRILASAAVLAAAAAAAPWACVRAAARPYRIAILGNEESGPWKAFRQALRELGYEEGRSAVVEARWSGGYTNRLPALAVELVALDPDIIAASGTEAVRAAMQATTTIPIVMTVSAYPDKLGLVQSLARPGGNVTGLSNVAPELQAKKLELLRELVPKALRVALIWNAANAVESLGVRPLQSAAAALGVTIEMFDVRSPDDFGAAFAAIAASRADALMAHGNPVNFKGRQLIADFALAHKLPSLFEERMFVDAGGLLSYAPSYIEIFRRAAVLVDKVLKGTKPADLPVEQPATFELAINLRTARALGLEIPASLLLRADLLID